MILNLEPVVTPPNIAEDTINNLRVFKSEVWSEGAFWELRINGTRWHTWNTVDHSQMTELLSSTEIAYGKVIATGLGFLLREVMLLANPKVTEVVVLENSKEVIEYQKRHNPEIMEKITVIHCDANEYVGECDTLLVDHYEDLSVEKKELAVYGISSCCQNIKHDLCWAWALEVLVTYQDYIDIRAKGYKFPYLTEEEWDYKVMRYKGYYYNP